MAGPSTSEPAGAEGIILTQRAGLALLWPFLEHFFTVLEALEAPAYRLRLLSYIGSGRSDAIEVDPLEALLAGVAPDAHLPDPGQWTDQDAEMCGSLMEAFRQNWPAVANTSVEDLRASFLARDGRLTEFDDRTHLVVQPTPFDMLLDQLPWSITTIQMNWMPRPLMVKWR